MANHLGYISFLKSIIVFLIFGGLLGTLPSLARSGGKIELIPALSSELNSVLRSVDDLHSACIAQDERLIEEAIEEVIKSLLKAEKNSPMAQVQQTHLVKILTAAKKKLEDSQGHTGDTRLELLREAFKDLVQISRVYQLEPYNIFFCNRDNSLWLQKSSRPHNPINPKKYGSCGKLVR